ncbi:MAG: hypothetical protein GY711_05710 [bacterium]|nr:hypothetical protein [bacterium]
MITSALSAAVFIGGKTEGFYGPRPGIQDEYERFVAECGDGAAFALGMAGGAARKLPHGDSQVHRFLRMTADPDLAVALIIDELAT